MSTETPLERLVRLTREAIAEPHDKAAYAVETRNR